METESLELLRNKIATWMKSISKDLYPGRFRFCSQGGLVPTEGQMAQMPTCFAMKIAWQAGLWDDWQAEQKESCVKFIQSFQREDGYFEDPWLTNNARVGFKDYIRILLGKASWSSLKNSHSGRLRAETRQSASTLLMVNEKPLYPLPQELKDVDEAVQFVKSLDWKFPWAAGSHLSHQLFLLSVNKEYFGYPAESIIDALLDSLSNYYDSNSGTWYDGNPSDAMKINGAMKVYSGLQWLSLPYPEASALMDFSLRQPFEKDGCGFLNRLFVIYNAGKAVPEGYRKNEVHDLVRKALNVVMEFKSHDGAFSFFKEKAQTNYYGATVSKGFNVSDLHGTAMFVWAIALALDMLNDKAPEGSEMWTPHKA